MKTPVLKDIDLEETAKHLDEPDLMKLKKWLVSHSQAFTDGKINMALSQDPPHGQKMFIHKEQENPYIKARTQRSNPENRKVIRKEVEAKLKAGIIERSCSPWSSNLVVVRRDGKVRLCTDYRTLNKNTIKDQYQLPKITQLCDVLNGAKYFSSVDACQAYHQLPLGDERSKDLTSFITPDGATYRYRYCAFGLVNAPAEWSRLIDNYLSSLR